ncbi:MULTISPECIES: hypothetical protein [unclassified Caballeronia]|uniref:hypothetical protein n=1 Tax=unclassified Caballeronia TaxID=2646786 RepID=UPI0028552142|nr:MULTISPECIES: hypothetical protein [unclassified Caballeronia]MDR5776902.1 hypothetical protein [Caballeronia sp. LZ002]MDR5798792.1 hypothetical protein [Caballeronia sp. LZ001]MDR5852313.1 hypothetical protein [Caballeronia sp. LZ003]
MGSNSFFLKRATARDADWQVSYPALTMASSIDPVDERRKQIVVAAADDTHVRMAFFSTLGAILDFEATWQEIDESARGWLAFTLRWNRWWLPNRDAATALERHASVPTDFQIAHRTLDAGLLDTPSFRSYLEVIEQHYRRDGTISRVLFPADQTLV